MSTRILRNYSGIGDSIYLNPIIKELSKNHELIIETPFPQFYKHLSPDIKFLRPNIPWRTQNKMMLSIAAEQWLPEIPFEHFHIPVQMRLPQPGMPMNVVLDPRFLSVKPDVEIKFHYGLDNLGRKNIMQIFEGQARVDLGAKIKFDMPRFSNDVKIPEGAKLAIIRPPTDRREWFTPSRQCLPEYTNMAAQILIDAGYYVVSVADVDSTKEWIVGAEPTCHAKFNKGELNIEQLMGLVRKADVVVGGVGWIVPACIAYDTPLFIIFGGRMGIDNMDNITDPRMNLKHVGHVTPRIPCYCFEPLHHCSKHIPNFDSKFISFLSTLH